ncbi:hypothetical protein FOG18_01720 [Legionella israelensis]|uniref:hypothetical protein n=1 Tax=Legionella israelensis TaxID=454 RepID=UPI001180DA8F|nr:hypothetical protein [Legionella israelensis]QDP71385.1 hypothetical protein FOG18_01720 [Legionella israelensis]
MAELLFKPETMAEMLAILAPNVQSHLQVSLSEDVSGSLKQAARQGIEPILKSKKGRSGLKEKPLLSHLSHYVINVNSI